MDIEKLKQLAEEFKESIELLIEKTKKYDLVYIETMVKRKFTRKDLDILLHNLAVIDRSHAELRLIDEFVEYVKSEMETTE